MDWDKLRVFHAVAEAGSFTHAGDRLALSQSAVSRQIGTLERSLGQPLFQRHARGLVLTEQGEILYDTVKEVFAKLAMTEAMLSESAEQPKGPLKITTTVGFGSLWLTPRIREFIEIYPNLSVILLLEDRELDLNLREADIAIRLTPPRQPNLIQRHLMKVHFHIYAARSYIEQHGAPERPEDLDRHRVIAFGDDVRKPVPNIDWHLEVQTERGHRREPVLRVNNGYAIYVATRSGLGIASLPDYLVESDPEFVRVLPDLDGPVAEAFFVYPEVLRHSKRIAVFREFLLKRIAETRF